MSDVIQGAGALVLVGTPIGNLGDLTPRAVQELRDADVIACEDTRRTRTLLSHAGVPAANRLRAVHAHNEAEEAVRVVDEVTRGRRVVYVSDAGMPGVSDPGARLVRACAAAGLDVLVVPGPSAVLSALVVSGLPTDRFVFEGFLPRRGKERKERMAALAVEPRTIVLYESPRRVAATLADLSEAFGPERRVAVARELTKRHEAVFRGTLAEAVAHVVAPEPRGEHVIVVGGAPEVVADVSDDDLRAALQAALAGGLSVRDAAAAVAAELSVPKRRAYELATSLER